MPSVSTFGVSAKTPPTTGRSRAPRGSAAAAAPSAGPARPRSPPRSATCRGGRRRSRRGRRARARGPRRSPVLLPRPAMQLLPPPGLVSGRARAPRRRRAWTRPCSRCTGTGSPGSTPRRPAARGTCPAARPPRRTRRAGTRWSTRSPGAPAPGRCRPACRRDFTTRPSTTTVCTSPRWAWKATCP